MWILTFALESVLISALFADPSSDLQKCLENVDFDYLQQLVDVPDPQELEVVCPMMIGYLQCVDNVIERATGYKVADLARIAPDSNVKKGAILLSNLQSLFTDLCTVGSDLNTVYKENQECFARVSVDDEACARSALNAYETYKSFENTVHEEIAEDLSKKKCLTEAYKSACIATQIHDECGQGAFDVYQQIIKRSSIFSLALCSEEDMQTLKTKFLSSLDLDEERLDLFQLAFDLRKRRK